MSAPEVEEKRSPPTEGAERSLTTVSVPEELEPIFLRAQDYVSRYFANRVENPSLSTISISGERYILLRAASMSVEFFDLVKSLYRDQGDEDAHLVASNILFDIAHAIGKADARNFAVMMGVTDPIEKLSAGPIHFAFSGWASVRISPESRPSADDKFVLIYDHPFSFEADSWIKRKAQSSFPVCVMNAGYSSGWCEESFGVPLVSTEIECLAAGGENCRFVMASPSRIEDELASYAQTHGLLLPKRGGAIRVPEFFQRKRMEDELRSSRDHLEHRVIERTAELVEANESLKREIAERQLAEEQIKVLGLAIQSASEGIVILRVAGAASRPRISFVNGGFCRLTGFVPEEVVGRTIKALRIVDGDRVIAGEISRHLANGTAYQTEAAAVRKDGSHYSLEMHLLPVRNEATTQITHWVTVIRDISERKAQLAALIHQALYDVLTDLPNRTLLRDRLEQAILVAHRERTSLALLVMDLDRFKEVNDTFGHQYGDLLLQQVAGRLRQQVRVSDTVARLGGDEFAILLPSVGDRKGATRVVRKLLKSLEQPFIVEGQPFDVGASVGIAIAPEHGTDEATLLRRADVAMYFAKQSNSGYCLYTADRDTLTPDRMTLAVEMRQALENGEFVLYYQPKVHMRTGLVTRVEALIRWRHPTEGLMAPDQFIPVAERTGLIKPLTHWVLNEALRQVRSWQDSGFPIHVAVNLSARSLQETFLPEIIAGLLEKWQVEPSSLKLEITESSILADPPHVLAIVSLLQTLGVRLSLDDFGTGYSSLTHLRQLPVDEIKIDKSFTLGVALNPGDVAIVRAMIDLAHNLGRQVCAEGVEDEPIWNVLAGLGCDLAQGYYLSRALPADELVTWLESSRWGLLALRRAQGRF